MKNSSLFAYMYDGGQILCSAQINTTTYYESKFSSSSIVIFGVLAQQVPYGEPYTN